MNRSVSRPLPHAGKLSAAIVLAIAATGAMAAEWRVVNTFGEDLGVKTEVEMQGRILRPSGKVAVWERQTWSKPQKAGGTSFIMTLGLVEIDCAQHTMQHTIVRAYHSTRDHEPFYEGGPQSPVDIQPNTIGYEIYAMACPS